jgi:acyl carrier protein
MSLQEVFAKALGIDLAKVTDSLTYQSIPQWDSLSHMILISEIENTYGVMLDTDELLDLSSVAKAREILAKHGVNI